MLLDEITKRFDELESQLDSCFSEQDDKWEHKFVDLEISHDTRVSALEHIAATLEDWKLEIEGMSTTSGCRWASSPNIGSAFARSDCPTGSRVPICSVQH